MPQFASLAASYNASQINTPPPSIGYPYPPPITPGTPASSRQTVYIGPHGVVQYNSGYLGQPSMMGAQLPTPQHYAPGVGVVAVIGPPQYGTVQTVNRFSPGGLNQFLPINVEDMAQMTVIGSSGSTVNVVCPEGPSSIIRDSSQKYRD